MERPNKHIQEQINYHLDQLVELYKDCINTELPFDLRRRGIAIMTNLFQPSTIDEVNIENLKEKLVLLEGLKLREKLDIPLLSGEHKQGWFSRVSGLLFKEKPILAKHWGGPTASVGKRQKPSYGQEYEEKLSNYERTESIHYSNVKYQPYKGVNNSPQKIEKLSNQEMRSRLDEKRLDGSPDSFTNRDGNRWGSFPSHDDYSENANP